MLQITIPHMLIWHALKARSFLKLHFAYRGRPVIYSTQNMYKIYSKFVKVKKWTLQDLEWKLDPNPEVIRLKSFTFLIWKVPYDFMGFNLKSWDLTTTGLLLCACFFPPLFAQSNLIWSTVVSSVSRVCFRTWFLTVLVQTQCVRTVAVEIVRFKF